MQKVKDSRALLVQLEKQWDVVNLDSRGSPWVRVAPDREEAKLAYLACDLQTHNFPATARPAVLSHLQCPPHLLPP